MICRYENMVKNPSTSFNKIYQFVNIPYPGKWIIKKGSWRKKEIKEKKEEEKKDKQSGFFDEIDKEEFKKEEEDDDEV